ncbi:MAG: TolC family protein, partial [Betaproteobacteria bacterium]
MSRFLAIAIVFLGACAAPAPRYERPPVELPQAWAQSAPRHAADGRWWRIYEDPHLDALVDEALGKNPDLVIAAARVDEARALIGEVEAGFLPTVDGRLGATRQQSSQRTATSFPGVPRTFSDYRATVNVSYELDLFGRLRSSAQAARAELAANEAARDAVRLALAAQVAKSYF